MIKTPATLLMATVAMAGLATLAIGQARMNVDNPMVGGMAMLPSKNIVENAINSKDHTTLVAAVKAAGLAEALMGEGPFTVFAPTNDAFENLPDGTVGKLLMPESKDMLVGVLTSHVAQGTWTSERIKMAIKDGRGTAEITTLSGHKLWASMNGPTNIVLKDEMGGWSTISTYDVMQKNGVIHVVNSVLLPKM
ncbi:MAG: fasciclin domain-containing protein [Fimbriimonadaceae bacterium]|nr:fasciclin domain-containing protein [Fimbriimonadaceae bacterium]